MRDRGKIVKAVAKTVGIIAPPMNPCTSRHVIISLIVLDIDFFKRVNDRFGHAAGDLVLKQVAQTIEATIRCSDALYRYGGEEFVVVLNGTGRDGARLLADRIRQNIEALCFTNPEGLQVTMSLGVTTLRKNDTRQTLFERADAALYQAKETGRNRVFVH
jgi:diguanylate cyclase (GGDEF)-like protein